MAQGVHVFHTLRAALDAGFAIYDRTAEGYLMRTRVGDLWAFALVVLRTA